MGIMPYFGLFDPSFFVQKHQIFQFSSSSNDKICRFSLFKGTQLGFGLLVGDLKTDNQPDPYL